MDPDFLIELLAHMEARDERDARRVRERGRESIRKVKGGTIRRVEH